MNRAKIVVALMLLIAFASLSLSPSAQARSLLEPSRADIEKFVAQAFAKQVTAEQVRTFHSGLNDEQKAAFKDAVDLQLTRAQVPPKPSAIPNDGPVTPQHHGDCWENGNTECWESFANSQSHANFPPGATWSSTYYWDQFQCDGTDPDWELVLYFPFNTGGHPDWTKWDSTDPALAALSVSSYAFKTFGYSFGEVRLCMPDSLVYASGGDWTVHRTTYIFR